MERLLRCEAVAWVDRDFPGWVRVRLNDAAGQAWYLVDKVPVFWSNLAPDAQMPVPVELPCDVIREDGDQVIVVPKWGEIDEFRVRRDQLISEDT